MKKYCKRRFAVSTKKLGCDPTKEASWRAANEWWVHKQREIDESEAQKQPHHKALQELAWRLAWATRNGETELAKALESTRETIDEFADDLYEAGEIKADSASSARSGLAYFVAFLGDKASIGTINEDTWRAYYLNCLGRVKEREWSSSHGADAMKFASHFIRSLWEARLIELPRNLNSRDYTIKVRAKKLSFFSVDELTTLISRATPKAMRLHLLLFANCGMYQGDVAELRQDEVDWAEGRIIRKRSKTDDHTSKDVPTVNYKLWDETFRLLDELRSDHPELVLLTRNGTAWIRRGLKPDGKQYKTDSFRSNYRRLAKRTGITKPPKLIRKTSANLIEQNRLYGGAHATLFLGHSPRSIKDRHYTEPSQELFDEAVSWLGTQYGIR